MSRRRPLFAFLWLGIAAFLMPASPQLFADPPAEAPSLETTLVLQKAMVMARSYLRMDDSKRAVEVLEQNLGRANGNTTYLELLRDAYRAYIKELGLKKQGPTAQAYLQRLIILDPAAASDPTLRADAPVIVPQAPRDTSPPMPNYKAAQSKPSAPPKIDVLKEPTVRLLNVQPEDDPFHPANQKLNVPRFALDPAKLTALLAKGDEEFERRRYAEARQCYEQAVRHDDKNLDRVRDRLAYCLLDGAVEQLNRNHSAPLPEIRKQVVGAVAMAPQLQKTGDWLLKEIDQRGRSSANSTPDVVTDPPLNMQHYGKNPQGWQVTETTNFRIFHNQSRELIERVALIAERTRVAMARKWFGSESETWSPKCEIVLHSSAADYSRLTNVPSTSPGHSRIETDPTTFRVTGRRIDLHTDTLGMLEAILPHETTHVVLAGNFGAHQVPRWADEGVAVLTEPLEKIEQHRRNLFKGQKEGQLLPVRELMNLANYPQAKQITAFYAQSVMLVEFLTQQRGPEIFTVFLRDGLQGGYEPALRKHYGWSFAELQANWDQHIGGRQVAAGR